MALGQRVKQYRPGYAFYTSDDNNEWVILADAHVIAREYTNV